ncbi:MAG TPA: hypothetical protein ENJ53_00185 [Phaeodactylibacter sp.]|nr:hypothetical protein [Phaeodactylibacter sp.]
MNYIKFLTVLLFAFTISSCEFGNSSTTDNPTHGNSLTDTTTKPSGNKPEKTDNWLVVPGKHVGRIQAGFSGADIYKMFGKDNVMETEIGLGEGETKKGLLIFPKTKNELQVLFEGDGKFDKIKNIKIKGEGSLWKTNDGITIGTTLEDLVKINGKDFMFAGFEWDYAGVVTDWNLGKIDKKLGVYLEPTNMEAIFPDLIGDKEFSSSNEKAKAAGLKVASFVVELN